MLIQVAEGLYQRGLLSYPRTETDQYDKDFDFISLIEKQRSDSAWGELVGQLLDAATGQNRGASDALKYERPRNGSHNDKAHPPIHPTAHANDLSGDDKKIYEYVTRRFLASCATDALGEESVVIIELGGERFHASGSIRHYPTDFRTRCSGNELPANIYVRLLEKQVDTSVR